MYKTWLRGDVAGAASILKMQHQKGRRHTLPSVPGDMLHAQAIKAAFTLTAPERLAHINARIAACRAYLLKLSQRT
jgi:hypothetical protein